MENFKRECFGENIRSQRIKKGFRSQKEFADAASISVQAVNYYESGKRLPDAETIYKIAKCLDCSVDWLFDLSHNANPDNAVIGQYLGLYDYSVSVLRDYYGSSGGKSDSLRNLVLNWLISDEYLTDIVDVIACEVLNIIDIDERLTEAQKNYASNADVSNDIQAILIDDRLTQIEFATFRLTKYCTAFFEKMVLVFIKDHGKTLIDRKEHLLSMLKDFSESRKWD